MTYPPLYTGDTTTKPFRAISAGKSIRAKQDVPNNENRHAQLQDSVCRQTGLQKYAPPRIFRRFKNRDSRLALQEARVWFRGESRITESDALYRRGVMYYRGKGL